MKKGQSKIDWRSIPKYQIKTFTMLETTIKIKI